MAWEEDFVYPFYLLLIGSGVLGGAVALLTHLLEWRRKKREIEVERERKKLEVRVDLVSRITEVFGSLSAKVVVLAERGKPISNMDEAVEKFLADSDVVHSLLPYYYSSEAGFTDRWYKFASAYFAFAEAMSLYFAIKLTQREKCQLKRHLDEVKNYFSEIGGNFCIVGDNEKIERNWDGLTPDMPYDPKLLVKINDLYGDRVSGIIKAVLELEIKVP